LTPDRVVLLLLVVECLLWVSNWLGWPAWHKGYAVLTCVAVVGMAIVAMGSSFFAALLFRWRFQFSIRSLLVMVVAVAIPCNWLAVEAKEEREAIATVDSYGGRAGVSRLPKAIRELPCLDNCRYFDRVDVVYLSSRCRTPRDELIRALKKLRHLKYVEIERSTLDFVDFPPDSLNRPVLLEPAEISAAIPDVPVSARWTY
jgi:hypothetical protein